MEKWPNLFIVGAPKAGTSSLYTYLDSIPGIFMSMPKEPNYFSVKTISENSHTVMKPIRDKSKYLDLFKKVKDEKIIGEASPSYLSDPEAPKLIHEIVPDAKIIISLRDPVERTFSYYLMFIRGGFMKDSFHHEVQKALKLVRIYNQRSLRLETGLYAEDIQRYHDIFGPEQVKIIIFEEFINDVKKTMKDILSFLDIYYELNEFDVEAYNKFGVPRSPISQFILRRGNVRRLAARFMSPSIRRILKEKILLKNEPKPEMPDEDREILRNFYREDVYKTEKILKQKLPWKNFNDQINP